MKIIYNKLIPFPGYSAMMLFGIIFARKGTRPLPERTINHESIHKAQAKDCHGYLFYYVRYLYWSIRRGYRQNPFEREAYENDQNPDYLAARARNAWKNFR